MGTPARGSHHQEALGCRGAARHGDGAGRAPRHDGDHHHRDGAVVEGRHRRGRGPSSSRWPSLRAPACSPPSGARESTVVDTAPGRATPRRCWGELRGCGMVADSGTDLACCAGRRRSDGSRSSSHSPGDPLALVPIALLTAAAAAYTVYLAGRRDSGERVSGPARAPHRTCASCRDRSASPFA